MKSLTIFLAAGASVASAPFALSAGAPDSGTFITKAVEGNLGEVAVGQLAQQKGASERVRSFGAMLVKDHEAANQKAIQVARSMGVMPPTEPGPEQKRVSDELSKLTGAEFDKRISEVMVGDHEKDITEYEKAAKINDAAGAYAKATLPTLRMHLDHARQVRGPRAGSPNT
jgi:putative membrane protein